VIQPAERVADLALISSLMPHANRRAAGHYRWALILGTAVVLVFLAIGLVPAAVAGGAVLVPALYVTYLADARLWRDDARSVLAAVVLGTSGLAVAVSLAFFHGPLRPVHEYLLFSALEPGLVDAGRIVGILAFGVALAIVVVTAASVVPIALVRRRAFDDMLDGFAFGVASGVTYAAAETLVAMSPLLAAPSAGLPFERTAWFSAVLGVTLLKPVLYGAAIGIAVAVFSGIGKGIAGFRRDFLLASGISMTAVVTYAVGVRVLWSISGAGPLLALLWGAVVVAGLLVYARRLLHLAMLEWAIQSLTDDSLPRPGIDREGCPECDMPLQAGAAFCLACGAASRATSATGRRVGRPEPSSGQP
jgi:hypothetical protein